MTAIKTQILTPDGQVYDGNTTGVQVPGTMGSFEIKKDHASIVSSMDIGALRIYGENGKSIFFAISGGFVEADNNNVVIMAEAAESYDSIDVARAEAAKERAEERLEKRSPEIDVQRAELALKRAINRLKLANLR